MLNKLKELHILGPALHRGACRRYESTQYAHARPMDLQLQLVFTVLVDFARLASTTDQQAASTLSTVGYRWDGATLLCNFLSTTAMPDLEIRGSPQKR